MKSHQTNKIWDYSQKETKMHELFKAIYLGNEQEIEAGNKQGS